MTLFVRTFAFVFCLLAIVKEPCSAQDSVSQSPSSSPAVSAERPTFKTILHRCAQRQKQVETSFNEASSSLESASTCEDLSQVRQSIEQTKKKLAELKDANVKSCALLEKAIKHLEKFADAKSSELIDQPDPDLDQVLWAF